MYTSPEIVFGFHGCDQTIADEVITKSKSLKSSENAYDWLGHGIYFWEGDKDRALEWAKNNEKIEKPAVVGAIIKLGNCLDLLDSQYTKQVAVAYKIHKEEVLKLGESLPKNTAIDENQISFNRQLDCAVIIESVNKIV